jgi:hypothetical protein
MAVIHDPIAISGSSSMPPLGALIGSHVSSDVFEAINGRGHASFFGERYDQLDREFFNRYVKPMDQLTVDLSRTVNALLNPDRFRILESVDDFRSVPLCMEMAIATFEPVRRGILEGRMEGFGYDPLTLPEDVYGRLLDNFTCEDVATASDSEGYYQVSGTLYTDDPDLDDDQLYSIQRTREYIVNKILKDTDRDPTAIDLVRG